MTPDPSVFARIPALAALEPGTIRARTMSGHTNCMFALQTPIGGFALRLPREGAASRVDRADELAILRSIGNRGITLPPLFFDRGDGTMLTRMEPSRAVRAAHDLRDDVDAAMALGTLLRRLHDSPVQFPWTFVAVEVVIAHFDPIDEPALRDRLLRLAVHLDGTVGQRVPVHDDVHPGNILWQDGRAWLIDWEYAGMNDPAFDLATASIELDLQEPAFAGLLRGWGRDDASWRERIRQQAILAHGIAGAWYLAQGRAVADVAKQQLGTSRLRRCAQHLRADGM